MLVDPVAIYAADSSGNYGGIWTLAEKVDSAGYPVFVSIKPDQSRYIYDGLDGSAHFVNMFARRNYEGFLRARLENNGVLYVDKEKLDASSLLSPKAAASPVWNDIESGVILRQKDPTVKPGERRFSAPGKKPKTGGNTGNVSPENGYERGSVADEKLTPSFTPYSVLCRITPLY